MDVSEHYKRLYRLPAVQARLGGVSRSFIYDQIARGVFPSPIKLGARAVAWTERDLLAWEATRERATPRAAAPANRASRA